MKKELQVNLVDIKVQDVSTSCIMLVSKFSRALKAKHGAIIHLQEPNVLNKVAAYAGASNSAELKIIYQQIEEEIRLYLKKKNPETFQDIVFKQRPISSTKKHRSQTGYRHL